jgi:hypothetical protein
MYEMWRDSFDAFAMDIENEIGPRPKGMWLHRIDNNCDYSPKNVRYAPPHHEGCILGVPHREHYLYPAWSGIKNRTSRLGDKRFSRYGGRGIEMYEPWRKSFDAFVIDITDNLGHRPPGATLDRIDNDGDYSPTNVQWATYLEQARNRECSKLRSLRLTTIGDYLRLNASFGPSTSEAAEMIWCEFGEDVNLLIKRIDARAAELRDAA